MFVKLNDGGELYYETYGDKGPWIVLTNGIMMSTASWKSFIEPLSKNNRLLLFDFRDQGKSSKIDEEDYGCDFHVPDLIQLIDHLGIDKINIVGVSYGGQVSLELMIDHQHRVKTLMLVTATSFVNNHLRALGDSWDVAAKLNNGKDFFKVVIPTIYSDSFYEKNIEWLERRKEIFEKVLTGEWFDSFLRLSRSAKNFDRRDVLSKIDVPTLLLCGGKDIITPKEQMKKMSEEIKNSILLEIPDGGHASFLEKPGEFMTAILGFVTLNN